MYVLLSVSRFTLLQFTRTYEINTRTYENNVFVQYNIKLKCHRNRLHRLIILRLLQIFKCINITLYNHFLALITKKIV